MEPLSSKPAIMYFFFSKGQILGVNSTDFPPAAGTVIEGFCPVCSTHGDFTKDTTTQVSFPLFPCPRTQCEKGKWLRCGEERPLWSQHYGYPREGNGEKGCGMHYAISTGPLEVRFTSGTILSKGEPTRMYVFPELPPGIATIVKSGPISYPDVLRGEWVE